MVLLNVLWAGLSHLRDEGARSPAVPSVEHAQVLATLSERGVDELPPPFDPRTLDSEYRLLGHDDIGYDQQESRAFDRYGSPGGDPVPFVDDDWAAFPQPTTSMTLDIDAENVCTMSFFGHYKNSSHTAGLTAGHCMEFDDDGLVGWSPEDSGYPVATLGTWDAMQALDSSEVVAGPDPSVPLPDAITASSGTDYATFTVSDSVQPDPRIAGRYTVVTTAGPADLRPGMEICKMGFRSKETCGPVISWNETFVRANLFSLEGDSGSPAYIRLGGDKVAALGMLSSSPVNDNDVSNDWVTDFALVAPVMQATGFRLGTP